MPAKQAPSVVEVFSQFITALVRLSLAEIEAEREEKQKVTKLGPPLLKPAEAYEYLAMGKTTFYKLVRDGVFKPIQTAAGPRYKREDLDRYINDQEEGR